MGVPKLTKMNKRLVSLFPKNTLMILKTFGKIFCGVTRQKLNFLEGSVTSVVNLTDQSNMVVVVL